MKVTNIIDVSKILAYKNVEAARKKAVASICIQGGYDLELTA